MRKSISISLIGILLIVFCLAACLAEDETTVRAPIRDSQPVWSPNGKQIAFSSNRLGKGETKQSQNIWVVDSNGENLRQLTSGGVNVLPSWSPDGNQIAFQADGQLCTVDVASSALTQLTDGNRGWLAPDWHPNDIARMVCSYQTFIKEDNDLAIVNPLICLTKTSGYQYLRGREGSDDLPRWSRDGNTIAFVGEVLNTETAESKWYLMTIKPDSTRLRTYSLLAKNSGRPSWLLDGSSIVVDDNICDLETGKATKLANNPKDTDVAPDGKRIVFRQLADGGEFLFTGRLNKPEKQQITHPE